MDAWWSLYEPKDSQRDRQINVVSVSQSICLSVCSPFYQAPNPFMLQTNSTLKSSQVLTLRSDLYFLKNNCWVLNFHFHQENNLKYKYMTSSKWFVCSVSSGLPVYQSTDPLEKTDLPGIVFRLSSLTITKALIRLDRSSSEGSDGLLVLLLCVLPDVVRACGLHFRASMKAALFFQEASYFYSWLCSKR